MTTTINASTSSGLVVTPDNSGNIALQYNGITTPTFQAYLSSAQTIPNSTLTTITWNATNFDTASGFNTSTGRYTPPVAGYYLFIINLAWGTAPNTGELYGYLTKNSTGYAIIDTTANGSTFYVQNQSMILYANGTTDYFYVTISQNSGSSKNLGGSNTGALFTGCLLRGA